MNSKIKNILVVFDAAGYTPVSIQTVVELAVRLQTGIQALYIEDSNLLNAVELPFTREVSLHTAAISSIDSALMIQKLQTDAESIKKQIEQIAVTRSVSLSFSSMRGQKTQIIKKRKEDTNIVLIPAVYSTTGRKQQHHLKHMIALVYDEHDPSSEKALNIAISQAAISSYQLFVIVDSEHSKQHVEQLISQQGGYAVCRIADLSTADEVLILLQEHSPGLLVLTEDSRLIASEQVLQQLINSLESDILLVR
jgi:hypothetical protein